MWQDVPAPTYAPLPPRSQDSLHGGFAVGLGMIEVREIFNVEVEVLGRGAAGAPFQWCPRRLSLHLGFRVRELRLHPVLARLPCSARFVLDHERRHAAHYRTVGEEVHRAGETHWRAHLSHLPGMLRAVAAPSSRHDEVTSHFTAHIRRAVSTLLEWMRSEAERRNAAMDTPDAYRAESRLHARRCPREVTEFRRAFRS